MAEISNYSHEGWQVICITNGTWQQNCYLIKNDNSNECIIIDPGSEIDEIISEIKKIDSRPIAILNTHGHYDHIGAVSELKEEYKIKFYVHSKDKQLIKHANLYRIIFDNTKMIKIPKIDSFLESDHGITSDNKWKHSIIFTPGHTEGSCCLIFDNIIFTGDTLLSNGPGRTDLPGGNKRKLKNSLELLKKIGTDKLVFPGHGKPFNLKQTLN